MTSNLSLWPRQLLITVHKQFRTDFTVLLKRDFKQTWRLTIRPISDMFSSFTQISKNKLFFDS